MTSHTYANPDIAPRPDLPVHQDSLQSSGDWQRYIHPRVPEPQPIWQHCGRCDAYAYRKSTAAEGPLRCKCDKEGA